MASIGSITSKPTTNPYASKTHQGVGKGKCSEIEKKALKCLTDGQRAEIETNKPFSKRLCQSFFDQVRACKREAQRELRLKSREERIAQRKASQS
mmetsp:Transcript_33524/g.56827  ORF Transcript_33524/g.56827 Transcript_33524/m.56827 type:complete len:95 (+) Transcript_33524:543-827(+)